LTLIFGNGGWTHAFAHAPEPSAKEYQELQAIFNFSIRLDSKIVYHLVFPHVPLASMTIIDTLPFTWPDDFTIEQKHSEEYTEVFRQPTIDRQAQTADIVW